MMFDERDLVHILRVVLGENRGNVLTDSLCFGIEGTVLNLLHAMPKQETLMGTDDET